MAETIPNTLVPEHLVGTREGLFHLLRGGDSSPATQQVSPSQPQRRLPRVMRYKDTLQRQRPPLETGQTDKSEISRVDALIRDDEFCFHR